MTARHPKSIEKSSLKDRSSPDVEYRPDDSDDEVDIRVRFPYGERNLGQLDSLTVPTPAGMVPISNFIEVIPAPKIGTLHRVDGRRAITVQADS